MKNITYILVLTLLGVILFSCGSNNKQNDVIISHTRFVLFVHMGDESAPSWPLLITTNPEDTTFYKYCKMERGPIFEYGFPLSETMIERTKRYKVNDSIFDLVGSYIIEEDTKSMNFNDGAANGNYLVFYQDDKDSIIFTVDGLDSKYRTCESCVFFEGIQKFVPDFDD